MSDEHLRVLQRAVAEDPTDRRAVVLLARLYEREGATATVFLLQDVNHEGPTFTRPFSTEAQAREVIAWLKANEGSPGDEWVIDEVSLDFFKPVETGRPPGNLARLLPNAGLREVCRESILLNICSRCGVETHATDGGLGVLCGACRALPATRPTCSVCLGTDHLGVDCPHDAGPDSFPGSDYPDGGPGQ